jgi:phage tail tape-measure protein
MDQESQHGTLEKLKRSKGKKLKRLLRSARRELIEKRQLTEELKLALAKQIEVTIESETKEEAIDFLLNLTTVERINQLKWLMTEEHQAEVERQFQLGVISRRRLFK